MFEENSVTTKYVFLTGVACVLALSYSPNSAKALQGAEVKRTQPEQVYLINVNADEAARAEAFVKSISDRGIGFLSNPNMSQEQRKNEFRKLLRENFDMQAIARFSLGRYWQSASEAQRREYSSLFERMIIEVYARRFGDYQGEAFEIASTRIEGNQDAIVRSFIVPSNGQRIALDWRLRKRGSQYKVIDIIVEGVSMATTQRSEFSSIIQRGGGQIDVLIDHLKAG